MMQSNDPQMQDALMRRMPKPELAEHMPPMADTMTGQAPMGQMNVMSGGINSLMRLLRQGRRGNPDSPPNQDKLTEMPLPPSGENIIPVPQKVRTMPGALLRLPSMRRY